MKQKSVLFATFVSADEARGPIAYIVRTNEVSPSDVFEPVEFASVFFFLFLCKKGERKKSGSECGPSMNKFLRPKQERVSQACLRVFS